MKLILALGGLLLLLNGCCCALTDMGEGYGDGYSDPYHDDGYGDGGSAEGDLYASEAGQYEGSDCWASAGCTGVEDGTYQYENYSSGSYEYYEE